MTAARATTTDLFLPSDLEAEEAIWRAPAMMPPAYLGGPPPPGAVCSNCRAHCWWTEAGGQSYGWRCRTCGPQPTRPEDRIRSVDTLEPPPEV